MLDEKDFLENMPDALFVESGTLGNPHYTDKTFDINPGFYIRDNENFYIKVGENDYFNPAGVLKLAWKPAKLVAE